MNNKSIEFLEEQLETLSIAFNSSFDGLHILDKDGYTLMINEACERIEGISADDIGNKNVRQLVDEGYFSESVTLKVLETKAPVTIMQKVKNGNEVLVTGMPIYKNGVIDKVIINSRDITELNMLKNEISVSNLLLEKYQEEWQKLHSIMMDTGDIVCNSKSMKKIICISASVAKVDSTILITGESGTGKGVISKFIHDNSLRKNNSFVKIDCGSIPDALFESEVFGYEKGAFTGADIRGKMGLAQLADEGTLFLDEIGEVPLPIQTKLLRLVQDKEIVRVGGKTVSSVNIRIIAATNKDLSKMVKEGKFREDLFYRLNVIPIHIPPLVERKEDITNVILQRIKKINDKYGTNKCLSLEAIEKLMDYNWPGNVRELENIIERIVILSTEEKIGVKDIPNMIMRRKQNLTFGNSDSLGGMMEMYEKQILEELLSKKLSAEKISKTLQIDVTTVRRKLHKYKLT
ncbi:MAG: sigma 54-interacting transcriptional regulator [Peptostreptococcaceae bacterium]|nr:sigma 54-interacting transcriptional regulator [Peptostreptococcaceae bacterium]